MPENKKPSPEELARLLKLASQKLGVTPEKLKSTLSDAHATSELLERLGGQKAKQALNDPRALQDLLKQNPQAQKFYDDLTGGKGDGK